LGVGSELAFVHSSSPTTKLAALEMGIQVIDEKAAENRAETIKEIVNNSSEVISEIISQNEAMYGSLSANQEALDEHEELLDNLLPEVKDVSKDLEDKIPENILSKMQYIELEPNLYQEKQEIAEPIQEDTPIEIFEKTIEEEIQEEPEKEFIIDEEAKDKIIGDTVYIKQTLRSGQVVNFDGNVVLIGDCHSGAEITASGDITIWGILEGIAQAGSKGNENAIIRALKIDAIQLRIAGFFARRPDRANIEFTEKTDTFTPEEARVKDGGIFIYTLNTEKQI
jgi:septum site-determining protein MinC